MAMAEDDELYSGEGLDVYERADYASGEHEEETEDHLSWYGKPEGRALTWDAAEGCRTLNWHAGVFTWSGSIPSLRL